MTEERMEVVKYCIGHNCNYKDTASLFDILYSQIYSWVKKYDANGEEGLSLFVQTCPQTRRTENRSRYEKTSHGT